MKKFIQKKLKEQKGMTLIELLAVIVIIAIIAAIAIPAIANIIENSRVGAAKSDALNAFSAVELYLAENGDVFDGVTTGTVGITGDQLVQGGYLDDLGSFEGENEAGAATNELDGFALNADGDLIISGTANNDGVVLTFTGATQEQVSEMPNGTGNDPAESYEGVISVLR